MLARTEDKAGGEAAHHKCERPLHFRAVIAQPNNKQCDDHRGRDGADRNPSQPVLVGNTMTRLWPAFHSQIANRKSQMSKSIMLGPGVKCASTQTERLRCFACVAIVSRQRFLDQKLFDVLETHVFQTRAVVTSNR